MERIGGPCHDRGRLVARRKGTAIGGGGEIPDVAVGALDTAGQGFVAARKGRGYGGWVALMYQRRHGEGDGRGGVRGGTRGTRRRTVDA